MGPLAGLIFAPGIGEEPVPILSILITWGLGGGPRMPRKVS